MHSVPLEEAAGRLAELVAGLAPGEELVLTREDRPVAVLKAAPKTDRPPRELGFLSGSVLHISPDFDEPPEGFEQPPEKRLRPAPGLGKGMLTIISDDDDHLKDFAEYMP